MTAMSDNESKYFLNHTLTTYPTLNKKRDEGVSRIEKQSLMAEDKHILSFLSFNVMFIEQMPLSYFAKVKQKESLSETEFISSCKKRSHRVQRLILRIDIEY